jgi:hypothetical protein
MEGNSRDLSHLRVRELWIWVVVASLLSRCVSHHVKFEFKWAGTMNAPASPFFHYKKKKKNLNSVKNT